MLSISRTITILRAECDRIREEIRRFITPQMNGLDIGSQGSPVFIQSISLDRKKNCAKSNLVQLRGDARSLYWFKDDVLDYVFSSHCFEDFEAEDKLPVLKEWIRVIKNGGYLILYLPNERKYQAFCKKVDGRRNLAHKDLNFNSTTIRNLVKGLSIEEVYAKENCGPYSFLIVYRVLKV